MFFSPVVHIDQTWSEVKRNVGTELLKGKKHDEHENCFFSEYDHDALENIINIQGKIIQHQKIMIKTTFSDTYYYR